LRQIASVDRLGKHLVTVKTQRLEDRVATLEEEMARLKRLIALSDFLHGLDPEPKF